MDLSFLNALPQHNVVAGKAVEESEIIYRSINQRQDTRSRHISKQHTAYIRIYL